MADHPVRAASSRIRRSSAFSSSLPKESIYPLSPPDIDALTREFAHPPGFWHSRWSWDAGSVELWVVT